jgi:hypothetical protein
MIVKNLNYGYLFRIAMPFISDRNAELSIFDISLLSKAENAGGARVATDAEYVWHTNGIKWRGLRIENK